MSHKRKPLHDARRRVNVKLTAIDEQTEFIINSVHQISAEVRKTANSLLGETNKTKFFNKYRAVSQELEKCLDDLLLISATISSLDDKDGDEDEESEESDDEDGRHVEEATATEPKQIQEVVPERSDPERVVPSSSCQEPPTIVPELKKEVVHTKTSEFTAPAEEIQACEALAIKPKADTCGDKPCTTTPSLSQSAVQVSAQNESSKTASGRTEHFNNEELEATKAKSPSAKPSEAIESQSSETYKNIDLDPPKTKTLPVISYVATKNVDMDQPKAETSPIVQYPKPEPPKDESKLFKFDFEIPVIQELVMEKPDFKALEITTQMKDDKVAVDEKPISPADLSADEKLTSSSDPLAGEKSTSPTDLPPGEKPPSSTDLPPDEKPTSPTDLPPDEKPISPTDLFAGDVIEEALRQECHELSDKPIQEKGPQIPPFEFPELYCLEVTVTDIVSPFEFWIQQTNGDLDLLMEEMCIFLSKRAKVGDKGGMSDLPFVGDICCARCTEDDVWYRALVIAVSRENVTVEVLYVDDGSREAVPLSRLRPLEVKFMKLPFQALCCKLSEAKLSGEAKMDEVNDWFKRRVSGETLEAVLAENETADSIVPGVPVAIHLYIRPPGTTTTTRRDSLKLEYNILEMMMRKGFSDRATAETPMETGDSVSPASSHSDVRANAESVCSASTTITSGFHEASPSCSPDPILPVCHEEGGAHARTDETHGILDGAGRTNSQGSQGDALPHRVPPPVIPVDSDGSLCMLVSHVVSAGEFYVHFITRDAGKLDTLMDEMNKTYEECDLGDNRSEACFFSPRVGDFCCAKFTSDGSWYRAVVLQVRSSLNKAEGVEGSGEKKSTINVEVFYIDFGNIESLSVENLRHLLPRFMELPAQVVRCSLADVEPLTNCAAVPDDVFVDTPDAINRDNISQKGGSRRSSRTRSHRTNPRNNRARDDNAIAIAAGDEDQDDDMLDSFFLARAPRQKTRSRSSISEDIEKSHRTPSLLSDTAVELFDRVWSNAARPNTMTLWSAEATELFRRLTLQATKLLGFLVPWDSQMVNNIANYCQSAECSLRNLGPVLRLNLYDISNDVDVFINGTMVKANYAISSTIIKEEEPTEADLNVKECEQNADEVSLHSYTPVVKMSQEELVDMALSLKDSKVSPPSSPNSSKPPSPKSPTLKLLDAWNPMSTDYKSFRNAYNVETDNLDVAITGYEENRGKICPFYRSKYGCFQGSKCPNKHVQEDLTGKIRIYGAQSFMSLVLPNVGTWVAVRLTAIYDPGHFWVQLPYGNEPLDSQIIKRRSGKRTSGEENVRDLEDLVKKMSEFYSKIFRREHSLAPAAEGELVALRYKKDEQWYRGKVCVKRDDKYQVCFVDYGFSDWINKNNVCPMVPHFLHLPFQAVECFLANVKPRLFPPREGSILVWSKDSKRHFETLTEDKVLVCHVLSTSFNETMLVNLFDTTEGQEVNISQVMIDSGYAEEADFKITKPLNIVSLPLDPRIAVGFPG